MDNDILGGSFLQELEGQSELKKQLENEIKRNTSLEKRIHEMEYEYNKKMKAKQNELELIKQKSNQNLNTPTKSKVPMTATHRDSSSKTFSFQILNDYESKLREKEERIIHMQEKQTKMKLRFSQIKATSNTKKNSLTSAPNSHPTQQRKNLTLSTERSLRSNDSPFKRAAELSLKNSDQNSSELRKRLSNLNTHTRDSLHAYINDLEIENKELRGRMHTTQNHVNELIQEEKINELERQLKDKLNENKKLKCQVDSNKNIESENDSLKNKNESLLNSVKNYEKMINEIKVQYDSQINDLYQQIENDTNTIQELQEKYEGKQQKLKEKIQELKLQMEEERSSHMAYLSELQSEEDYKHQLHNKIQNYEERFKAFERNHHEMVEELKLQIKEKEMEVEDLKDDIVYQKEQNKKFSLDIVNLKKQHQEKTQLSQDTFSQIIKDKDEYIAALEENMTQLNQVYQEALNENMNSQATNTELQEQNDQINIKYNDLQKKYQDEIEVLEEKLKEKDVNMKANEDMYEVHLQSIQSQCSSEKKNPNQRFDSDTEEEEININSVSLLRQTDLFGSTLNFQDGKIMSNEPSPEKLQKLELELEETKNSYEKQIKKLQQQIRAAYSELQSLRKDNIQHLHYFTESGIQEEEEIDDNERSSYGQNQVLKQEFSKLIAQLEKKEKENQELEQVIFESKVEWAEENNFLRTELERAEQMAINAKLQFAQMATQKDDLQFKLKHAILKLRELSKSNRSFENHVEQIKECNPAEGGQLSSRMTEGGESKSKKWSIFKKK